MTLLRAFVAEEQTRRPAVSSLARTTKALKRLFRFLVEEERLVRDPALPLRTPKKWEVLPDTNDKSGCVFLSTSLAVSRPYVSVLGSLRNVRRRSERRDRSTNRSARRWPLNGARAAGDGGDRTQPAAVRA